MRLSTPATSPWLAVGLAVAATAACTPPGDPRARPSVPERPAPTRLEDSAAYQHYRRVLAAVRAGHRTQQPVNLVALLRQSGVAAPKGCAVRDARVRRIEIPRLVKHANPGTAAGERTLPKVALLFVQPQGYQPCVCGDRCNSPGPEPTLCAIAVVPGPRSGPQLKLTSPNIDLHADLAKLSLTWSTGPAGRWLVTVRYQTHTQSCGGPPGPQRKKEHLELIGYHAGQFQAYLSELVREDLHGPGIDAWTSRTLTWVPRELSKASVLAVETESLKKEDQRNPRSGDPIFDITCFREATFYRLDLAANKLRRLTRREAKALLDPSAFRDFVTREGRGDDPDKCSNLLDE